MPELKEARPRNQRAFLCYDKVIVYENADSATQSSHQPPTEDNRDFKIPGRLTSRTVILARRTRPKPTFLAGNFER